MLVKDRQRFERLNKTRCSSETGRGTNLIILSQREEQVLRLVESLSGVGRNLVVEMHVHCSISDGIWQSAVSVRGSTVQNCGR